jgi:hypothetical protein
VLVGNRIPTFRGNVVSSSSRVKNVPEEYRTDYPLTQRYIPEETDTVNTVL